MTIREFQSATVYRFEQKHS